LRWSGRGLGRFGFDTSPISLGKKMDIALILSADKYSIPDSATGEIQHLHQVWMSNEYRVASETEKGCKPMKVLVEPAVFVELMKHDLPSVFEVDVKMRPGKGNAVAATVTGFKFLNTPKIFAAPGAALAK
jgi:hypothetical protein